ncbi:TniQ family protein [Paracoccus sp. MC1862]|uniref:TniQ family protein n=1 Tax=Paracoccus sp. MC1862 TaxID=2760307 RepID=UPI00160346FD|nr:TniQ family protein [Paracoccus sp. MC1862]MBB1499272.1 TniQ family protein [Paracoccus sp. MC1862]QQO45829.1 TniQ family protein [Paracoccus sp. MC1862]
MPTLFPFLPFDPFETPVSFATRLAALHTGGRLVPFLHDIGVRSAALAAGDTEAVQRLCALAGIDSAPVLRNTARTVGRRRADLRGEEITAEFLSSPDTVFCPACLAQDDIKGGDNPGTRRGRLAWTLRVVRTCPHHEIALVHLARNKWSDQFHELAERVPERGGALLALADNCERRSPSPLQTYVMQRLEGEEGPEWLDGQTLEQAVRATEMLGALIAFGAGANLTALDASGWDRAGRIGYACTAAGEAGIRDALQQVQAAFRGKAKPGRRKVFGRFYEWLSSTKGKKDPGDIKRILREHIFDTMEVAAGEEILGATLKERRLHSVRSLASEVNLNSRTLRNFLASRGLVPADEALSEYHVFDANAGRTIAASVCRSIHVISLPKALNCTRPQADQLLAERILTRVGGGPGIAPGRTQRAADASHVADFLVALRRNAMMVGTAPDGVVSISKAAEKAKVPCYAIVHLILGGYLQRVFQLADVAGYAGVLVDPIEVQAQIHHVQAHLSASAAFKMMWLPVDTGWALVDAPDDLDLKPVVIEGPSGYRFCRFDRKDASEFMERVTTVHLIALRLGVEHKEVVRRLKIAFVRPAISRREAGMDLYSTADLPASLRS